MQRGVQGGFRCVIRSVRHSIVMNRLSQASLLEETQFQACFRSIKTALSGISGAISRAHGQRDNWLFGVLVCALLLSTPQTSGYFHLNRLFQLRPPSHCYHRQCFFFFVCAICSHQGFCCDYFCLTCLIALVAQFLKHFPC